MPESPSGREAAATAPGLIIINLERSKMTEIRNSENDTPSSSVITFIVLRREPGSETLRASPRPQVFANLEAACAEAQKRACQCGGTFVVLQVIGGVTAPLKEYPAAGDGKPVGPVTAAIRAARETVDEPSEPELEILNRHGDVVGRFGIMAKRYRKPTSKRRSCVPIGGIAVGAYGCKAVLYGVDPACSDLGAFRTAAEAEAAILAATPFPPHPAGLPPTGSARH